MKITETKNDEDESIIHWKVSVMESETKKKHKKSGEN